MLASLLGPPPACCRDALADLINRAERSGDFGGDEQLLPLAGEALRAARAAASSIRLLPAAVQREQLHKPFLKVGMVACVAAPDAHSCGTQNASHGGFDPRDAFSLCPHA